MLGQRFLKWRPSKGLGVLVKFDIHVPLETAWDLVRDIDSHPKIFDAIYKVVKINDSTGLEDASQPINAAVPGKKYMDYRFFAGKLVKLRVSVTSCKAAEMAIVTATEIFCCTTTTTMTLSPVSPNCCSLLVSYGLVPNNICGRLYLFFVRRQIQSGTGKQSQESAAFAKIRPNDCGGRNPLD